MKLLRNPWIVALLGLGAVVYIVSQVFHPGGIGASPPSASPPPPAAVAGIPAALAATNNAPQPVPILNIDLDYVRTHFANWITSTQRDPFLQARAVAPISTNALMRQLTQMKLKAIWRQGDVGMVAINDGIYRSGDDIEGCHIERVESNGVWLTFNGQREFLFFGGQSLVTTNAPPTAPPAPKKSVFDYLEK